MGATLSHWSASGKSLRHPFPKAKVESLIGQSIIAIRRRAKFLLLEFPNDWLIVHLGMSGMVVCCDPKTPARLHDHVRFNFSYPGGRMRAMVFHDPRRFGSVQWFKKDPQLPWESIGQFLGRSASGLEPFDPLFNGEYLFQQSRLPRGGRVSIKQWLMAGHVVVGVGNIYACEALFRAGIHPARQAKAISHARLQALADAIRDILQRAIHAGGSTIRDFHSPDGEAGRYGQSHRVYGHQGETCSACQAVIRRMIQHARSTFYCPRCQR
jgi:formamidopyrimidine-DNA glycosylase